MKTILVTGGAGFIGVNFIEYLLDIYNDYRIINLDKLTYAGFKVNIEPFLQNSRYEFLWGDVANSWTVEPLIKKADMVVHFAAESNVDLSIIKSDDFLKTNILGTKIILDSVKKYGVERILIVSTDEVYGNAYKDIPSQEDSPLMPCSPYAAAKASQDILAFSYYVTYNLPVIITRCSNNYGPKQDPTKLIPRLLLNAIHDRHLPVYGRGINKRDWIYVKDHNRAIDRVLHSPDKYNGEVFNVGSGVELSSLDIAKLICKHTGKPESLITFVEDRKGHVLRHAVNSEKIKKELGFEVKTDFSKAIKETIQWYINNPWWWKAVGTQQAEMLPNYKEVYGFHSV